jgi:hypothetical protein
MTTEELLKLVKAHEGYLEKNHVKLDMYEGNLLPYVTEVMRKTLSDHYFKQIEHRIIPINVLTRIIDKLSKVYVNPPLRTDEKYQEFLDTMSYKLGVDLKMSVADSFSHLFKGYALEPYIDIVKDKAVPSLRVLPYDRFIVGSTDKVNPLRANVFIKIMGKVKVLEKELDLYYAYTDNEFIPFTSDGEIYSPALEGNDGINPYGIIPFVYGNRSLISLVPTQDTDITQMTMMIPIVLSDLGGAIMFSAYSVIYGIDLKIEKMEKSPNSFWNFKSDAKSDNPRPEIGTIKTDVDIDKVLNFIKQTFVFWLETKGVRIGSLNNLDAGNGQSGIAKIIDEMDVYEIKKQSINFFKQEEKEFWEKLAIMNNKWLETYDNYEGEFVGEDFDPTITFDEPKPEISRTEFFTQIDKEYKGGYMDAPTAIAHLYPDLDEEQIKERVNGLESSNKNKNTEPVQQSNSDSDSE